MSEGASKVCALCGQDCSRKPRVKDRNGNYYCRTCHDQEVRERGLRAPAAVDVPVRGRPPPVQSPFEQAIDEASAATGAAPQAPPVVAGMRCPGCAAPMAADAVVCVRCGYDAKRGRKLKVKARTAKEGAGAGAGLLGMAAAPPSVALACLAILGLFFMVSTGSVEMALAFNVIAGVFGLVLGVTVLVFAFMEGLGQGFLTLCVPFYVLYFIYGVCENGYVRWLFPVNILAQVGAVFLGASHGDFSTLR